MASRLEALTRELAADMVVSEALAREAVAQAGLAALEGFTPPAEHQLRGREAPIGLRAWRREA